MKEDFSVWNSFWEKIIQLLLQKVNLLSLYL